MLLLLICAFLVNWLATTIVVEAHLLQPLRDWVAGTDRSSGLSMPPSRRPKLAYLLGCHLCSGTWVGFAMAAFIPGPFTPAAPAVVAFVLHGLLFKAGGHLVLHLSNLSERIGR